MATPPTTPCPACGHDMINMQCKNQSCETNTTQGGEWDATEQEPLRTFDEWIAKLHHENTRHSLAMLAPPPASFCDSQGVFDSERKYTREDFMSRLDGA